MVIEVILKDGRKIYPAYEPEHKEKAITFFKGVFEAGAITGWAIRL